MTSPRALGNELISAIDRPVQKARWGTLVLFLLHGLIVGTWIARIPAFQIALKLNNAVLGLTLVSATIGAILSIPATGKLIDRYGSRRVSITSTLLLCGALAVLPWVFSAVTLATILLPFGATAAAMDISMNAHGVEVEKRLGSPTMSRFHGMFSLGAMTSAGVGGNREFRLFRMDFHARHQLGFGMPKHRRIVPLPRAAGSRGSGGARRLRWADDHGGADNLDRCEGV